MKDMIRKLLQVTSKGIDNRDSNVVLYRIAGAIAIATTLAYILIKDDIVFIIYMGIMALLVLLNIIGLILFKEEFDISHYKTIQKSCLVLFVMLLIGFVPLMM